MKRGRNRNKFRKIGEEWKLRSEKVRERGETRSEKKGGVKTRLRKRYIRGKLIQKEGKEGETD